MSELDSEKSRAQGAGKRAKLTGLDRRSFVAGLCVALAVNGGGAGLFWWLGHSTSTSTKPTNELYLDVKLMKFGAKRDLSFLPKTQAAKTPDKATLKVTDQPDKAPNKDRPKDEPKAPDLSKLNEAMKNIQNDERSGPLEEGDPHGVKGGTANEASGDPYIQAIVAAVLEKWTVPTMLTPGQLLKLQAAACLKIDDSGRLVEFTITEPSGNNLFDGSLLSALGSIRDLPKPSGRFAQAARTGKLCPFFAKQ